MAARRRRGAARHRDERERRVRLPRRRRRRRCGACASGPPTGASPSGAQVGVPRPGRVRAAPHRVRPVRAARRDHLSDRGAGRVLPAAGRAGPVRQAARRALQHGGRRRVAGVGDRGGGRGLRPRRCRCCASPDRCSPSTAVARRTAGRGRGIRRPRLPGRRNAGPARAAGRCAVRRGRRGRTGGAAGPGRGGRGDRRLGRAVSRRVAVRPRRHTRARSTCAGGSALRSMRPACAWRPFVPLL